MKKEMNIADLVLEGVKYVRKYWKLLVVVAVLVGGSTFFLFINAKKVYVVHGLILTEEIENTTIFHLLKEFKDDLKSKNRESVKKRLKLSDEAIEDFVGLEPEQVVPRQKTVGVTLKVSSKDYLAELQNAVLLFMKENETLKAHWQFRKERFENTAKEIEKTQTKIDSIWRSGKEDVSRDIGAFVHATMELQDRKDLSIYQSARSDNGVAFLHPFTDSKIKLGSPRLLNYLAVGGFVFFILSASLISFAELLKRLKAE